MKHLDFVIWVLGFPITVALIGYINNKYKKPKEYSEATEQINGFIELFFYFFIGYLVWSG